MQYRMPYEMIFNGSFASTVLRNGSNVYTCRIFTADADHTFLGSLQITTDGPPPTTQQIERAIRDQARDNRATALAWHMHESSPEHYTLYVAPMIRDVPTSGEW